MSPRSARTWLSVAIAAFLVGALGAAALGARMPRVDETSPEGIGPITKWGWMVVRDSDSDYMPRARDRGNSAGGTNTVAHDATGEYTVTFGDLADPGGIVHVSVLGAQARICDVAGWKDLDPDLQATILCYDAVGVAANATFSVDFMAVTGSGGRLAYLWADDPSDSDYLPDPQYSYNSVGEANSIQRLASGSYRVTLPGLGSDRGHVQVSAYDFGFAAVCNVESWTRAADPDDLDVYVRCWDAERAPADSTFELTFMQGAGLKGVGGESVAYLWATDPSAASYTPSANHRYSSPAATPHIDRLGAGVYRVVLPEMPKGGGALVTAYGRSVKRCNIGRIRTGS